MLTIELYSVACEPAVVDKESYITDTKTVQGTIRGEFDVQRPVIDIDGDLSGYNYAKIGSRYYHIVDCNRIRTGISTVSMTTDVLWTFRDQIYNLPAVVNRSYRMVNAYLPDPMQRVNQYTRCVNKPIGTAFTYSDYGHILMTVG